MSRSWFWFEAPPKQPVPKDGLRVDRFGDSWWGAEWLGSLRRLSFSFANRLPRGRSYARSGRVVDLAIGAGIVTAGVVGTRARPYSVEITINTLSREQWRQVIAELASEARFTVSLLRGELPAEVGERLQTIGVELFPSSEAELTTTCSCPDWANPCKHVAAVFCVVAAALDADPFLAFVLRGLDRTGLLAALAENRGGQGSGHQVEPGPGIEASAGSGQQVEAPGPWEQPEAMDEAAYLGRGLSGSRLSFRIAAPEVECAGLRRLGAPPPLLERLPSRLGATIGRAGREALRLASAGPEAPAPSPPSPPRPSSATSAPGVSAAPSRPKPATTRKEAHAAGPTRRKGRSQRHGSSPGRATGAATSKKARTTTVDEADQETRRPARRRRRSPGPVSGGGSVVQREDPLEGAICEVLARYPAGASRTTLCKEIRQPFGELKKAITSLRKAGRVAVNGSGIGALFELRSAGRNQTKATARPTKKRRAPATAGHRAPSESRTSDVASGLSGRVLALLETRRLSMSARQIAEELRVDTDTLRPVVLGLRRAGKIVMVGERRGARYRLPD